MAVRALANNLKLGDVFLADPDGEQFRMQKVLPIIQEPVAQDFLGQIKANVGGDEAYNQLIDRVTAKYDSHFLGAVFGPREFEQLSTQRKLLNLMYYQVGVVANNLGIQMPNCFYLEQSGGIKPGYYRLYQDLALGSTAEIFNPQLPEVQKAAFRALKLHSDENARAERERRQQAIGNVQEANHWCPIL